MVSLQLAEVYRCRFAKVSMRGLLHISQRNDGVFAAIGRDTVLRHDDLIVANVCVVCGEKNTNIGRNSGQNHRRYSQMLKQSVQCRSIESGRLGFQNKVVILVWNEQSGNWSPRTSSSRQCAICACKSDRQWPKLSLTYMIGIPAAFALLFRVASFLAIGNAWGNNLWPSRNSISLITSINKRATIESLLRHSN